MRIGRDFTNLLEYPFLTDEDKELFAKGERDVPYMDALCQIKAKADIKNQIDVAKRIGLTHVELDGGVPNPYLAMSDDVLADAKAHAAAQGVTLSLHLPYTYVGASTCAFQEEDRLLAVELQKKYLDCGAKLGVITCVMHPGSVPFYQATGKYRDDCDAALERTLRELIPYATERGIKFHLENNTKFDSVQLHPSENVPLLQKLRADGLECYYCFDIGHWYTNFATTAELPDPPESIMEEIPEGLCYQVHLNDFIPEKIKFHPPLHYESGPLKKKNLIALAEIFRKKGVELVVVETAVREREELIGAEQLLRDESAFLNEVFLGKE